MDLHCVVMTLSTVIPIPKSKNCNQMDSINYSGITFCFKYGKLFDLVILSNYSDCFMTSDLQLGFKTKRSTAMCTMILKDAVTYYINYGSSVYCTLLMLQMHSIGLTIINCSIF